MTAPTIWTQDDRVFNPAKPEWGTGKVTRVRAHTHQGVRCQMLTVRFDRAGIKNVSTGIATLVAASTGVGGNAGGGSGSTGTTRAQDAGSSTASAAAHAGSDRASAGALPGTPRTPGELSQLPPAVLDTAKPASERLKLVLDLYRYTVAPGRVPAGGSGTASGTGSRAGSSSGSPAGSMLLEWAISQTGLVDPLSTFSRTELEAAFETFLRRLDDQVRPLVRMVAAEDLTVFADVVGRAHPAGRAAAQRLVSGGSGRR